MYRTRCRVSLSFLLLLLPALLCGQDVKGITVHFKGQVVDGTTGVPIAGVRVRILPPSQGADVTTDSALYTKADTQGRFAFPDLPVGLYTVTIRAPGYGEPGLTQHRQPNFSIDLNRDSQPAARLQAIAPPPPPRCAACLTNVEKSLAADGTLDASVVISLTPVTVIAGRVTDPDGLPMPSQRVRAIPASSIAAPGAAANLLGCAETWSNDLGEFRIAHLPPGSYYLTVIQSYDRFWLSNYHPTFYPHAIDISAATPLVLGVGQQLRADIQIAGQSGSTLSGSVSLPAGSPRAPNSFRSTSISLLLDQQQIPKATTYASGGRFAIEDVLPGTYILTAVTLERPLDAPVAAYSEPLFGRSRQITIADGETPVFDLELLPLREVPGDLSFAPGCRSVRVSLVAEIKNSSYAAFPVDPADERFVLTHLQPGFVHVRAVGVSSSGSSIHATSIRLGDEEVSRTGFAYPFEGDRLLHVTVDCGNGGAR